MRWKQILLLILLGFVCFGSGFIIRAALTDDDKQQQLFEQNYHVYSLPLPDHMVFANQKINLTEYDVKERFDRELLTNVYWQSQTLLMLKRANRFFPVIERILKEEGIPDDMKYVGLIESGLLNVVSPAGAAGFWQMLDKTGKQYGLTVNEEVDERYHLEKATVAACKYFKEAYTEFNDWSLVAASYNMGIDGVKKQMQNQYGNTYFDLYLNTETSRYLFRILALKEIAEHTQRYGFYIPRSHLYAPIPVKKIQINASIDDLAKWAVEQHTTYKTVKLLNPWLRKNTLTVRSGEMFEVSLKK
jgi:hypothetical protein